MWIVSLAFMGLAVMILGHVLMGIFPRFTITILSSLGFVRGVVLSDSWGTVYYSIKKQNPFGGWYAHVHPFSGIGSVQLKDDGTCEGESSYIKKWKDL